MFLVVNVRTNISHQRFYLFKLTLFQRFLNLNKTDFHQQRFLALTMSRSAPENNNMWALLFFRFYLNNTATEWYWMFSEAYGQYAF